MLSKFDDYPIHQTSQPIAQPATERPQRLRPLLVQRLRRTTASSTSASAWRCYPNLRHPRLRPQHRARRRAARLPRVAARAAGADRAARRAVPDRGPRADARHPRRHRRQRHRHRGRPHVHRAHRVRRGGPPDRGRTDGRPSWTSPASRSSARGRARSATTARPCPSTRRACTAPRTVAGGVRGVGVPDPGLAPAHDAAAGLLPLGAAALGRPLHALRRVRGRRRPPVAHRRRGPARLRRRPATSRASRTPAIELLRRREHEIEYLPGTRRAALARRLRSTTRRRREEHRARAAAASA